MVAREPVGRAEAVEQRELAYELTPGTKGPWETAYARFETPEQEIGKFAAPARVD
jgi:hypothetical protein